jgi:hypothetical protein
MFVGQVLGSNHDLLANCHDKLQKGVDTRIMESGHRVGYREVGRIYFSRLSIAGSRNRLRFDKVEN